jgi:hypothetical protein
MVGTRAALPRTRLRAHLARPRADRDGGRHDFHFVTQGFEAAYAQAHEAARDDGVDIAGGASTVRQALVAGVIDELTLDVALCCSGPASGYSTKSSRSTSSLLKCSTHRSPRTSATDGRREEPDRAPIDRRPSQHAGD